ncbi:MAG: acyltransferase [Candidatus Odinarchaeota archaeon]
MVLWVIFQLALLLAVLYIGIQYFYFFYTLFGAGDVTIPLFLAIVSTLFTSLFILALIHKIARILMRNEVGILTGWDRAMWGITMTSADTAYFIVNKLFINQIYPAVFYKLFGAKLGKRVAIFTRLWDVELMEIGNDTFIGTECIIGCHAISQGELFRGRITIGSNCTIGAGTIILPGVTIEDRVIVASNSVIPSNRVLKANSIYAGSPVKRIRDWNGESVWEDPQKEKSSHS